MLKPKTSKLSLHQITITKFEFGWSNLWMSKGKVSSKITSPGVTWQETGLIVPGWWQLLRRERVTRTREQGRGGETGHDNNNKMDEPLKSHLIGSEGFWRQDAMNYIIWALMSETAHCRLEFQWVTDCPSCSPVAPRQVTLLIWIWSSILVKFCSHFNLILELKKKKHFPQGPIDFQVYLRLSIFSTSQVKLGLQCCGSITDLHFWI